ncbi:hypothetical protein NPX13_g7314 [Xylaria arbuscula]|uniref:Uncharacterized protein n=1 Tax=Xylaria arbuscula TaxID=114810 RepID=A0A9W8NAX3_9PEZI|nr:hypothetical protein NPX13_g7314 [Xylaria arbuscula]
MQHQKPELVEENATAAERAVITCRQVQDGASDADLSWARTAYKLTSERFCSAERAEGDDVPGVSGTDQATRGGTSAIPSQGRAVRSRAGLPIEGPKTSTS